MRLIIAGLLTAVLIQLAPSPEQHINQTSQDKANFAVRSEKTNQPKQLTSVKQVPDESKPEKKAKAKVSKPAPKQAAKPKRKPTPTVPTSKQQLMRAAGIPQKDWAAVDYIVSKESSWRHTVWNKGGSGAYGLCQALPASKMASAGQDYMTNPVTQLKWCHSYAHSRYDGWRGSFAFWRANSWW